MNALLHVFDSTKKAVTTAKRLLWRFTATDAVCVTILLLVAMLLRFPFIGHPEVTQYDEVTYANYAMHMIEGKPFVDIHPPLARMLFAEVARTAEPFKTTGLDMTFNQPPGDFPLTSEHNFIALLGTLLPLIVYVIARLLLYTPRVALLLGLFVASDNALIIFSRVMLPDMPLFFFAFLSLMFGLLSLRAQKRHSSAYTLLAAMSIGCAISIKWTGLGVLLSLLFMYLLHRRYVAIVFTVAIAALVYVSICILMLFTYFPSGGMTSNLANESDATKLWVAHLQFPKLDSVGTAVKFLTPLHAAMMKGNTDPELVSAILKSQGAYSWPIARNRMVFWHDNASGKSVIASGNDVLWIMSFFAFIFDVFWILAWVAKRKKPPMSKHELFLLFGYSVNFLPFFFIERPMYLYHYFIALIFLILLLPKVMPRIVHCLKETSGDELFAQTFVVIGTILIFVNVFFTFPLTYGY